MRVTSTDLGRATGWRVSEGRLVRTLWLAVPPRTGPRGLPVLTALQPWAGRPRALSQPLPRCSPRLSPCASVPPPASVVPVSPSSSFPLLPPHPPAHPQLTHREARPPTRGHICLLVLPKQLCVLYSLAFLSPPPPPDRGPSGLDMGLVR